MLGKNEELFHHSTEQFSVLVPCRNEAENLPNLLADLAAQTYLPHEVWILDDGSTDGTAQLIQDHQNTVPFPLFYHLVLPQAGILAHKKLAIAQGVARCASPWVACTDGDCRLPPRWLETHAQVAVQTGAQFVGGPVGLFPHPAANSLIARFLQKLFVAEFASLIGVGAVGIAVGRPNMANGANMAFSKAAFEAVGGYEGSWHIPSGDDEWLLQRIHAHFPGQIAFAWGTGALVTTAAPRSWSAFAQQRKRWASKWTKSQSGMGKLLAVSVFGFHLLGLWALVGLIMETENRAWLWAGILAKMLTETLFVGQVLSDTDRGKYVKFLPLISLLYPLYACYFGLAGIFGTYEWKGREARHKI